MASFLRKFVKAKSRSKSPTKLFAGPLPTGYGSGGDRAWLHDPNYRGHGIHDYNYYPEAPSSSSYADASQNKTRTRYSQMYTNPPNHVDSFDAGASPYGGGHNFFDADELSEANIELQHSLLNGGFHTLRHDTNRSPSDLKKSPKQKSTSPIRQQPPNALISSLSSHPHTDLSPMLSSQPQYYFTPDYKIYEDVEPEKMLRVPSRQQQLPYSPLLSGQASNVNMNTTMTCYHEAGPSSSNTLSPAWPNAEQRNGSISTTLRPTHSEHVNGSVVGTSQFFARSMAPATPTSGGSLDVTAYNTPLVNRHFVSNGYLSGGTGVVPPTSKTAYYVSGQPLSVTRPRSVSPRKTLKGDSVEERKFRSRSPTKRSSTRSSITKTLDYLHAQCKLEGCSAVIIVEDTQFLVCKHQLSHASEFFRTLFLNNRALPVEGAKQTSVNEYTIIVSGLKHPPQSIQFQWFIETTVLCPILKPIADNSLETCMRLSKRFSAKGLEFRCAKFIQDNVEDKPPMMALCWLNWVFKHRFDRATHDACVPVVARLPLQTIERHRQMLPERAIANIIAMKLRTCYQQTAKVFYTIHKMDHFHVNMDKCPRCSRQREQGKVRVQANPCQKLIGCESCLRDIGCEIERKSGGEFEAFHQCEHGLWPLNDQTEDCYCQMPLYKINFCATNNITDGNGTLAKADNVGDVGSAPIIPPVIAQDDDSAHPVNATLKRGATLESMSTLSRRAPSSVLDVGASGASGTLAPFSSKLRTVSAVGGTMATLTRGSKSN